MMSVNESAGKPTVEKSFLARVSLGKKKQATQKKKISQTKEISASFFRPERRIITKIISAEINAVARFPKKVAIVVMPAFLSEE